MPTSHPYQLNEIVELILLANPKTMLDVGVGFGKYGFLAREYLELWDGREKYDEWTRRIDGVEAFPKYLTPIHRFVYNQIYVGNAVDVLPTLEIRYDLLTAIDVLEHFDYESGLLFLNSCCARARTIIISTPKDIGDQKDAFGSSYETHRFQWKPEHLKQFKDAFFIPEETSFIACFGEDAARIRASLRYSRLIPRLKRCFPLLARLARTIKGR